MEFKPSFFFIFFTQTLMIVTWLWLAYRQYNSFFYWHYSYLLCLFTASLWFFQFHRSIYSSFSDKSILTVNENYIYDFVCDIKYEWSDIEEINEKDGNLYIKLYNPIDYIGKIGNPHRRFVKKLWFKSNTKRSLFAINLSWIKVKPNDLLEILEDYSIKSTAIK